MKTSFVSTASVSSAMRNQLIRMQTDLLKAQKEVATGRHADIGIALGSRTSQSVTLARDLERLNGIVDSNGLVSSRLTATQDALKQISESAQTLLSTLTASVGGDAKPAVTLTDARGTLDALTSVLNTSLNGEHLFAGINTDVEPINSFTAPGSPAKAAFDAAFLGHFGFTQSDPAAANISAAQMDTFLDTVVEPQFLGAGWQANWSNATDDKITSRIALNETMQTSVNANNSGVRKLAMAAATISDLFTSDTLSPAARGALLGRAVELVGESIGELAITQAETGIAEQRVNKASERLETQLDLFERTVNTLEGVDPYEASTRVSALLGLIETSYALTARISQLSLTKFL